MPTRPGPFGTMVASCSFCSWTRTGGVGVVVQAYQRHIKDHPEAKEKALTTDQQVSGVVVLMAQDADALAALAEIVLVDGLIEGPVVGDIETAIRHTRAALAKRLAVMGDQSDRLVNGQPVVVRLQEAK